MQDIPIYTIGADCRERAFHRLAIKRYRRLGAKRYDSDGDIVCSTRFYGKPVTPPRLPSRAGLIEYSNHIVKVRGKVKDVSFLFRESDMYFVAFTPDKLSPAALWYRFRDTPIPSFLKQATLNEKCSYPDFSKVQVGYLILNDIVEVLSKVCKKTAKLKDDEREQVLLSTCLMLSEPMRSGELQLHIKQLLRDFQVAFIPEFERRIRCWSVLGRYGFQHECGREAVLVRAAKLIPSLYNKEKKRFEIWNLIGRRRRSINEVCRVGKGLGIGLLITLFDPHFTINYILNRKGYLPDEMKKADVDDIDTIDQLSEEVLKMCVTDEYMEEQLVTQAAAKHVVKCEPFYSKSEAMQKKLVQSDDLYETKKSTEKLPVKNETLCSMDIGAGCAAIAVASSGQPQQDTEEHCGAISLSGVCLEKGDTNSFCGSSWVTDDAIEFILATISCSYSHEKLVIVPPGKSARLSNCHTSAVQVLELCLESCSMALVPVNSQQFNTGGGSGHWSLLVLDNTISDAPRIVHLDSQGVYNIAVAYQVSKVLSEQLPAFANVHVRNAEFPKQEIGSDCSLYVIEAAEVICKWWFTRYVGRKEITHWESLVRERLVKPNVVGAIRQRCLQIATAYVKECSARELEKLTTGNVTMLRSDLNTLLGKRWLNDAIITFIFDIFQDSVDGMVLLAPPNISRLLSNASTAPDICEKLKLSSYPLILVAINDLQDSDAADVGSHWSLLAIDRTRAEVPRFIHIDSLNGMNSPVARGLADKVRLNIPQVANAQFMDAPMPNQPTSYNCGVYTLLAAETICEWCLANLDQLSTFDWIDFVVEKCQDPVAVHATRGKYIKMIESYAKSKSI